MNRIASWLAGITLCMLGGTSLAADLPAVVGWLQRVELGTLVSGVVSEVHVRPGQQVRRGDKLLSLEAFSGIDAEDVYQIVEEAGRFASRVKYSRCCLRFGEFFSHG